MESRSYEDMVWLRQEYLGLQRCLRSGQQQLHRNVQLLKCNSASRHKSRSMNYCQLKTSTPKLKCPGQTDKCSEKRDASKLIKYRGLQTNLGERTCRQAGKSRTSQRSPLFRSETDSESSSSQLETSKSGEEEDPTLSQKSLTNSGSGCCQQRRRYSKRKNRGRPSKISCNRPVLGEKILNVAVNSTPKVEGNTSFDRESEGECLQQSGVGTMPQLKSILSTPGVKQQHKTPNRVAFMKRLNRSSGKRRMSLKKDQSLLGYDFIAGVLQSDSRTAAISDQFFEEICQFRQVHREQCVHDYAESVPHPSVQNGSEDSNENVLFDHKCIHNYKVNQRLFPLPSNESRDGESLCAVCQSRKDSTRSTRISPSYIRVSIPRSTLVSPYRARPHRRRSFDSTDSLGISKHCSSGWQCSKPSMMPTAGSLDIHKSLSSTVVTSNFNPEMENLPPTAAKIPRTCHRT